MQQMHLQAMQSSSTSKHVASSWKGCFQLTPSGCLKRLDDSVSLRWKPYQQYRQPCFVAGQDCPTASPLEITFGTRWRQLLMLYDRTGRRGRHGNKPAWAMTEDRARAAEAAAEQKEEEDLLGFADSLDYDAYLDELDDAELKSALQVRLVPTSTG